jgi:hypothetical protein
MIKSKRVEYLFEAFISRRLLHEVVHIIDTGSLQARVCDRSQKHSSREKESILIVDFPASRDYVNAVQTRHMVVHDD